MAVYGRKVTTDPAMAIISASTMRGTVYDGTIPANSWLYAFGGHFGKGSGSPVAMGHVHSLNASNQPAALVASTAAAAVTTSMGSGTVAAEWRQAIPFKLVAAAFRASLGIGVTGGQVNAGMIAAAAISAADEKMYLRAVSSAGPWNPAGYTSSSTEGWLSLWVEYQPNRAPTAPTSLSPAGTIAGEPAGYSGTFNDPDRTIDGRTNTAEKMSKLWIQLRAVGSSSLIWDTGAITATAAEATANRFTRQCPTQLDAGVEYEWRSLTYDAAGAPGPWSAFTKFKMVAQGSMTPAASGTVRGRQVTLRPTPFKATYNHNQGKNANLIQVDILSGTTVIRTTQFVGTYAPGAAPAIAFPAAWADLAWSNAYKWRMRARDVDGLWSNWSAEVAFTTNYRPNTPSIDTPSNGDRIIAIPTLRGTGTDPDNTPSSGLTATATVYDGAHNVTGSAAMAYVNNGWQVKATAAMVPGAGPYTWTMRLYDGLLYGGYAAEESFFYVIAPVLTAPVNGYLQQTTIVSLEWQESGIITGRRLKLYDVEGITPVLMTGWGQWDGSTGWDIGAAAINGRKYELAVEVRYGDNSTVESERVTIEVLLNATHSASLTEAGSGPVAIGNESETTAIELAIGATTGITAGNHRAWNVRSGSIEWLARWNALIGALPPDPADALRAKVDLAAELELEGTSEVFSDPSVLAFTPRFNRDRVYVLTAVIQQGVNTIESLPAGTMPIYRVECYKVALTTEADPYGQRLLLESMENASFDDIADQSAVQVWDDEAGLVIVESGLQYTVISESFMIRDTATMAAMDQVEMLQAMRSRSVGNTPSVVVNRDDLGQRHRTKITSLKIQRARIGAFEVSVEFTEVGRDA